MSNIDNLRDAAEKVAADLDSLEKKNAELAAQNEALRVVLEDLRRPKPPVAELPDVVIQYDSKTLKPEGEGDLWSLSGERRWTWDVRDDVRVILDCKGAQRRVILRRAWGDMTTTAATTMARIKVILDGEVFWDGDVRIHARQSSPMTFRRLPMPEFDLKELKARALVPNYRPQAGLDGSIPKRWEWKPWAERAEVITGKADRWSERFGLAPQSWVGGVPLANEASMLPPWDVTMLLSPNVSPALWEACAETAESVGNYTVHYYDRATGRPYDPASPACQGLPVINPDNLPALHTVMGLKLPVADLAHNLGLPNVMAMLTGERFYVEALESMVLLGSLARKGEERASGTYWSGQVRAAVWWLRDLYHLNRVYDRAPASEGSLRVREQLYKTLDWMASQYANPSAIGHRSTGLCAWTAHKTSLWMQYASPQGQTASTGHMYFLSHVLGEIHRSGIVGNAAEPMLRHALKVAEGTWKSGPSKYLAGWLQHSLAGTKDETWKQITERTFRTLGTPPAGFIPPLTSDIIAWHRAAVVVAVDLGEPWAQEALDWIDDALAQSKRTPGIVWQIEPTNS